MGIGNGPKLACKQRHVRKNKNLPRLGGTIGLEYEKTEAFEGPTLRKLRHQTGTHARRARNPAVPTHIGNGRGLDMDAGL